MSQGVDQVFTRLFKASPEKILALRPGSFEIIAATDDYLKATMTRESDIVGKTLFELFPDNPDDDQTDGVQNLLLSLQRVQSLKAFDIIGVHRYPIRLANGSFEERFWRSVNSPVLDDAGDIEFIMHRVEEVTALIDEAGSCTQVVAAERDTTERKEAELLMAGERFELISRATDNVFWDWDLINNTVWWSDAITEQFGYTSSELEPGPESWTRRTHPDDLDRLLESVYQFLDSDKTFWSGEFRFFRSDGKAANVIGRGTVIRNGAGRPVRMMGSMIDITERVEMEQRLRESQRLEAIGHLTGGVAHDFNNLLTVIQGNAEMLTELSTDPNLQAMAEMTLTAARRGAELTKRLLAFARRQPLDPKATDLNQLVAASQALIRRTLPENIELEFVPDPNLGIAEVDANELDTALLNLVVNARDAMRGGGKLTIETANAVLDRHYADRHPEVSAGEYVMVGVSDTGIGMDADTAHRAFEPFFTTKSKDKGSGLGLSMVFGFTKQSGGHIKIYSEPNEGTSVKLYFPRARGVQHTHYQPPAELQPQGGTEHILIAEDDDLVLEHLERQLRSLGYRVTTATSGPDAFDALGAHGDVELLLTDIIMPGGMSGRELADRARVLYPSVKVLFTSGYTENAIVHHGRLDPDVNLLSKPYSRLELATKVREVLDAQQHCESGKPTG
jgi:PAS domain S-box-containing protein